MATMSEPPEGGLPELSWDQRRAVAVAIQAWAQRHPTPDRPVWGYAEAPPHGREMLSPRELARELEEQTHTGEDFLRAARFALLEMSFDEYVASIHRSATEPGWLERLRDVLRTAVRYARLRRRGE